MTTHLPDPIVPASIVTTAAMGMESPPTNRPQELANSPITEAARDGTVQGLTLVPFFTRMLVVLAVVLSLRFIVPSIVEEMQYAWTIGRQRAEHEVATEVLADSPLENLSLASQMVSQRVAPSVVHIETRNRSAMMDQRNSRGQVFGRRNRSETGQGSGVIITGDGHLLTNLHVVDGFDEITVRLTDGRQFPARILGVDKLTDLALVKIEADDLIAAEWGNSDRIEEGAFVWAVGSPFGFQHSITSGIVSAKNRSDRAGTAYQDFLQTDAAVNPGNSGGPLVDSHGRVIGINTMIVGPAFQGVSLAIPSNVARQVYDRLKRDGYVGRGWLGVELVDLTPELSESLQLTLTKGAFIFKVVVEDGIISPAASAGLLPRDIIIRWDGESVTTKAELSRAIAATPIGRSVDLVIVRDGQELPARVEISERPSIYN